jgi:hypothetical protein
MIIIRDPAKLGEELGGWVASFIKLVPIKVSAARLSRRVRVYNGVGCTFEVFGGVMGEIEVVTEGRRGIVICVGVGGGKEDLTKDRVTLCMGRGDLVAGPF